MQIFPRSVHKLTRGSAAIFALYIMYRTRSNPLDLLFLGAAVMLMFDAYTFIHTFE